MEITLTYQFDSGGSPFGLYPPKNNLISRDSWQNQHGKGWSLVFAFRWFRVSLEIYRPFQIQPDLDAIQSTYGLERVDE